MTGSADSSERGDHGAPCPCDSGSAFARCCGPYLAGTAEAATAEALMRARYVAHARGDAAFLTRSWHPSTTPPLVTDRSITWTGLEVRSCERGRALDREGTVTFAAHWQRGAERGVMVERSRFGRLGTRWVYVDGESLPA